MPGYPNRSFDPVPLIVRLSKAKRVREKRLARAKRWQEDARQARVELDAFFLKKDEREARALRRREWFEGLMARLFG